jgi:hypothetical protein
MKMSIGLDRSIVFSVVKRTAHTPDMGNYVRIILVSGKILSLRLNNLLVTQVSCENKNRHGGPAADLPGSNREFQPGCRYFI